MKTRIVIGIVFSFAVFALYYFYHPLTSKVRIKSAVFTVDLAITEAQKAKGLGGRNSILSDHGMLFVYDHKEQYNFWMKGMRFPLDFVWIDDRIIVDMAIHVPAPSRNQKPVVVIPRVPVDKVLELPAGTIERLGITIGDTIEYIDR